MGAGATDVTAATGAADVTSCTGAADVTSCAGAADVTSGADVTGSAGAGLPQILQNLQISSNLNLHCAQGDIIANITCVTVLTLCFLRNS